MTENKLYSFITMEKKSPLSNCDQSSSSSFSFPLFGLINFFLIGFFRWGSFAQTFFSRFCQSFSKNKNKDLEVQASIKQDDSSSDDDDEGLYREDAEMVMKSLGLLTYPDTEGLQKQYSSKELSVLFEEKEPSLEEVKQAFDVFDENRDGFIDPIDLQRVLTILGLKQGSNLENCRRMIRSFDGNKDGRIDFYGFVKFMENNFY